jgi:hypothetical protein
MSYENHNNMKNIKYRFVYKVAGFDFSEMTEPIERSTIQPLPAGKIGSTGKISTQNRTQGLQSAFRDAFLNTMNKLLPYLTYSPQSPSARPSWLGIKRAYDIRCDRLCRTESALKRVEVPSVCISIGTI